MSLAAPLPGAYVVVWLDPVASLEQLDDPIVRKECQKMKCGRYIACMTEPASTIAMILPQCAFEIDFVVRGLPSDDPSKFFHHSLSVPILPNTSHPTHRRPLHAFPPLPWNDCYHAGPYHVKARCETGTSRDHPQSSLSLDEAAVLSAFMISDGNYVLQQERARDAGKETLYPPPIDLSEGLQDEIEYADKQLPMTEPWWYAVLGKDRQTDIDALDAARAPGPMPTHLKPTYDCAQEPSATSEQEPSGDDIADLFAAILSHDVTPELQPFMRYNYDLSGFDSPPDPAGFFEELAQLDRIKAGFFKRYQRRLDEVKLEDDAYIASLEARGMRVKGQRQTRLRRLWRIIGSHFCWRSSKLEVPVKRNSDTPSREARTYGRP
ncbi:hypothetical protein BD626DRAFT_466257, partial [Schizophyllum amplum]